MTRYSTTTPLALLFLLIVAMITPLKAASEETKLEDILYRGTVQDLKEWLSKNDNRITSKHQNIWDAIHYRFNFTLLAAKLRDPLTKEDEKNKAREEIRVKVDNNLILAELVLKAVDQKTLDLLNKASPPDQPSKLAFLYDICESSEIPIDAKMKFIELFVARAKNKIWFDEFGLFMSFYSFLNASSDKQAASCVELVGDTFIRSEDWHHLEDQNKLKALIKKVTKLYKR